MNNAIKGALLSGLVFPGLGQLVLRQYRRGILIMLTVSISLSVIVVKAILIARDILQKVELQGDVIDLNAITDAASRESLQSGSITLNFLLIIIIICWIAATVDAYRSGRKLDRERGAPL
jgi:TM2 domain-containing membrane protein YozV